jgi:hypothetical protein
MLVILFINKSNRPSATRGMVLLPDSKMENTEAGCSELCKTWSVRWGPVKETEEPSYNGNIRHHFLFSIFRQFSFKA